VGVRGVRNFLYLLLGGGWRGGKGGFWGGGGVEEVRI